MYTSMDFLQDVRIQARISDTDPDWTDSTILRLGFQELFTAICPWLLARKENHFVKTVDVPVVVGRSAYRISALTMGAGLRDVKLVSGDRSTEMRQVNIDSPSSCSGEQDFTIEGNLIVFRRAPQKDGTLRQYINAKPGKLVASDRYAEVISINGNVLTVSFSAGLTAGAVNNKRVSIIAGSSPYDYLVLDVPVTSTGSTISLGSAVPPIVSPGDIVCLSGESIVPQIPEELVTMLVLATAARILESLNYQTELATVVGKITAMKEGLAPLFENRIQGAPESIESVL